MTRFEYKVVPAPSKGQRGKGVKGADGKFANVLETLMNQMGSQGWEYQRAETLPSEERAGLTSKTTVFRNVLVFRRVLETDLDAFEPKLLHAPTEEPVEEETAQEDETLADAPEAESEPDTEQAEHTDEVDASHEERAKEDP